jgi:transposase-like protein
VPDPEVVARPERRRFSAEYKLRILKAADESAPGELGALLRREGLYASHLSKWRRERAQGQVQGLHPKTRGRKPEASAVELARVQTENEALRARLEQAEAIIEAQKKLSLVFGLSARPAPSVSR